MEEFIHRENLIIFKRRLAVAKSDEQRQMLLKLLAEEEARDACLNLGTKRTNWAGLTMSVHWVPAGH